MEDEALTFTKGRIKLGHGHTINSDNHTSNNNNGEHYEHNNIRNTGMDDAKGNHKHTSYVMNEPGIASEKWTSSQSHKTLGVQVKVYNTGRKKPDEINHIALTEQRIQQVRNTSIVRRTQNILRNNMMVRINEPERPAVPGNNTGAATEETT
jgi:hypothetical protein